MGRPGGSISGAGWRRPSSALLLLLLLLLLLFFSPRGASAWKGETCRRWVAGETVPVATFLCPEKEADGADAFFCCGTCARSFCCAFLEARLDQRPCFREDRQGAPAPAPTPTPDGAPAAGKPHLMYTVFPFILTISVVLGILAVANYKAIKRCLRCCKRRQPPPPVMVSSIYPVGDPTRQAPLDLSSPHSSREILVSPYSEEDSQGEWDPPPPYPGDPVVEFRRTSPGMPMEGVVTLFPLATLPDKAMPGNTPGSRPDTQ